MICMVFIVPHIVQIVVYLVTHVQYYKNFDKSGHVEIRSGFTLFNRVFVLGPAGAPSGFGRRLRGGRAEIARRLRGGCTGSLQGSPEYGLSRPRRDPCQELAESPPRPRRDPAKTPPQLRHEPRHDSDTTPASPPTRDHLKP